MTKAIDDPTTTDVNDAQVSIEGKYIGPMSARQYSDLPWKFLVTNDPSARKSG